MYQPAPSTDSQLTSKKYVDTQISTRMSLSGWGITGDINSNGLTGVAMPVFVANKTYADAKLDLSGGTMTAGDIDMSLYVLKNVPAAVDE